MREVDVARNTQGASHHHHLSQSVPILSLDAIKCVALHHEEGGTTAEVKNMKMSGVGIAPGIAHHPHIVMCSVETTMIEDIADEVKTEVGGGVVIGRMDVKRAKSTLRCTLGLDLPLPFFAGGRGINLRNAKLERQRKRGSRTKRRCGKSLN